MRSIRRRFNLWHLLLAPVALVFLFPLVQLVMTSLEPEGDINRFPPRFWPSRLTLAGYAGLFDQSKIARWFLNTVIVAGTSVLAHLVLCSLAGYGFARLKFPGRNFGFLMIVATIMIPTQLLMIPPT
jgi:multiple sugar transport system permease protein